VAISFTENIHYVICICLNAGNQARTEHHPLGIYLCSTVTVPVPLSRYYQLVINHEHMWW